MDAKNNQVLIKWFKEYFYSPSLFTNNEKTENKKMLPEVTNKTSFKMIDISSTRDCCPTWCSSNNKMFFKTSDQMMLIIGCFETEIKYLIMASCTVYYQCRLKFNLCFL